MQNNNSLSLNDFKAKLHRQRPLFLINEHYVGFQIFVVVINMVSRGVFECHVGCYNHVASWRV